MSCLPGQKLSSNLSSSSRSQYHRVNIQSNVRRLVVQSTVIRLRYSFLALDPAQLTDTAGTSADSLP